MESNPDFHDPGPKPTRYVGFSPGSWKPGLAWSEATTARHFPPPVPQLRQPGGKATGYSAAGAISGGGCPLMEKRPARRGAGAVAPPPPGGAPSRPPFGERDREFPPTSQSGRRTPIT